MNYIIENNNIKLTVSDHGAEIKSLIHKAEKTELMWQADPAFWGRTAPILFPLVGNYYGKKSVYAGRIYEMGQHGFARDMDFALKSQSADELVFTLVDTEETKARYPFGFVLTLSYKIIDSTVNVGWMVENTNEETMYFSIGGHPAFNCDLDTYTLRLEKDGRVNTELDANIVADDGSGCLSKEQEIHSLENGILNLSDELFAKDALIVENRQCDAVTLVDPTGRDVLSVKFDAPLFGIWSPVGKHAPLVCIEPWYGRCDRVGFNQKLEEREYGNVLKAGEVFRANYDIVIS